MAREDRLLTRLLQIARLSHAGRTEDVNFRVERGLNQAFFLSLAGRECVRAHQVTRITGRRHGNVVAPPRTGSRRMTERILRALLRLPRLLGDLP